MNFRQLVKTVDTRNYYEKMISPVELRAQYNPERFYIWKSLHTEDNTDFLNMLYSPHYKFLINRNDRTYFRLQKKFGRKEKWIVEKVKKFLTVLQSLEKDGFKESIDILEIPLVKNRYNKSFEIFEGHHRVSCALFLNIKKVPCRVIRRKDENY